MGFWNRSRNDHSKGAIGRYGVASRLFVNGRTENVELDGYYVPDAPPAVLLERVNGRHWNGRTCPLEAIFVTHISTH